MQRQICECRCLYLLVDGDVCRRFLVRCSMRFTSLLLAVGLPLSVAVQAEQTLTTPTFTVKLKENCEEGVVGCDGVTYHGTNRKTGKAITLKGKTHMVMCADRE